MTTPLQFKPVSFWTPNKFQQLLDYNEEGLSASQIGRRLGCSRNAVIGKLMRKKVKLKGAREVWVRDCVPHAPKTGGYTRAATEVARVLDEPPSLEMAPIDIGTNQCRWMSNDPQHGGTYCGHVTAIGESYCPHHRARAFQPIKPSTVHRIARFF